MSEGIQSGGSQSIDSQVRIDMNTGRVLPPPSRVPEDYIPEGTRRQIHNALHRMEVRDQQTDIQLEFLFEELETESPQIN